MKDEIKLEDQLCFSVYAASRELIKRYGAYLKGTGLTYTQYITLVPIWESGCVTVKELCKRLHLDSGTLTPVLKNLEANGYIKRTRCEKDGRLLTIEITENGRKLHDEVKKLPDPLCPGAGLSQDETDKLRSLLHKLLNSLEE